MSWKKIGATSGYVAVGTVATQLFQWVIMAGIGHFDGAKALGLFALGQALILPLQYISWLSIRSRYLITTNDDGIIGDFLFLRATVPAVAYAIAFAATAAFAAERELVYLFGFICIFKYIEGFYDLIYSVMQKAGEARLFARLAIVRTAISGAIFLGVYYVTKNLYAGMLLSAIQQAGLLLFVKGYLSDDAERVGRPAEGPSGLRRRWRLAIELFPLGLSLVLMSLNSSIPRFLLNGMVGAKELGYYAAIGSFISLGTIAAASLGQSLLQPFALSFAKRTESSFWKQLLWPMVLVNVACAVGAIASYFIGSILLTLIYGPAFRDIGHLLVAGALTSGPVFAATIASNAIFAAYMRNALFWTQVFTVAFTTLGIVALVPVFGLLGVFVANALSGLMQILICVILLLRFWASFKADETQPLEAAV